jgi:hypothetical protein
VAQRGQLHPGSLSGLCRTVFSLAWVHGSLPCHQIPASSLQPQKAFCFAGPPGWGWSKRAPPSLFPATLLPHASLFRAPSVPSLLPCPWLLTTSDPYPVYCPLVHWPPCYCYLPAQSGEPPGPPCPGPPGQESCFHCTNSQGFRGRWASPTPPCPQWGRLPVPFPSLQPLPVTPPHPPLTTHRPAT